MGKKSLMIIVAFLLISLITINFVSAATDQQLKNEMKKCVMGRQHVYYTYSWGDWDPHTIGWNWVKFDNENLDTNFAYELFKKDTFSFDFSCSDIIDTAIKNEIENSCTFCYRYADNFYRNTANWTCAKFSEPALTFNFIGSSLGNVDANDILDINISCENEFLQNNFQLCKRYADHNLRDKTDWQCVDFDGTVLLNDFKGTVDENDDFDLKIIAKGPDVANLPPIASTDYSNLSQCQICRRFSSNENRYGNDWECVPFNSNLATAFDGDINNGDNYDLKLQCPESIENLFTLSRRYAYENGRNTATWQSVTADGDNLDTTFVGDVNTDDIFDLKIETSDNFLAQNCQLCRRYTFSDTQRERTTIEIPPTDPRLDLGGIYEYLNWQCVDFDGTALLTDFYGDVDSSDDFDLIINCMPNYCVDSDGGKNLSVKGSIKSSSGTFYDSCSNSTYIIEGYCLDEPTGTPPFTNVYGGDLTPCPQGYNCSNGACIAGPPPEGCESYKTNDTCLANPDLNCTWTPPGTTNNSNGGGCCPLDFVWDDTFGTGCKEHTIDVPCTRVWTPLDQIEGESYKLSGSTYQYCAKVTSGLNYGYWYDVNKF